MGCVATHTKCGIQRVMLSMVYKEDQCSEAGFVMAVSKYHFTKFVTYTDLHVSQQKHALIKLPLLYTYRDSFISKPFMLFHLPLLQEKVSFIPTIALLLQLPRLHIGSVLSQHSYQLLHLPHLQTGLVLSLP